MSNSDSSTATSQDTIEQLKTPSASACKLAVEHGGPLQTVTAEWQAQRAPGREAPPADDARRFWMPLRNWSKLTVPSTHDHLSEGEAFPNTLNGWRYFKMPPRRTHLEAASAQSLPDQWPPDRDYHHAWYVLQADLGQPDAERMWLRFDAVAHQCVAFVNGQEVGRHIGGYTPFELDINDAVRPGVNTLAMLVQDETAILDHEQHWAISQVDGGRGNHNAHFAGIRGGVYLEARRAVHAARVRVRPSTRTGTLAVETWVRGKTSQARLKQTVYAWPHGTEPVLELPERAVALTGDESEAHVEQSTRWADPKLWSPAHPNLYVLRTTIESGGCSESIETRFGFREFWIEGDRFMLNGKPIRLLGDGSKPQELDSTVPEVSRAYGRRVLEFLKREFNYMACRLHGVLFPVWAVQAADEAGYLIIDQSSMRQGRMGWYEKRLDQFLANTEAQFAEWYWRDVNNPSVVIWDVENELIRGQRTPEREQWVLQLDEFIKNQDPDAITEHSGAAWYSPDQQIIHVHMQEQYNRVMRTWLNDPFAPLVLGEFWMGGRGETRLPNSYEYTDRKDWHTEEARLYREQMLEMRYHGVSGMMPHRLTHWPLRKPGPLWSQQDAEDLDTKQFQWRFSEDLKLGGRGLAPIVGFIWPRGATVIEGEPFTREVVVCNDSEDTHTLNVNCAYGEQTEQWQVTLEPAEQRRLEVTFTPDASAKQLAITVDDKDGRRIEADQIAIHVIPASATRFTTTTRRLVFVPEIDEQTANALKELDVPYSVSETLPSDAAQSIVIVPPGAHGDALGMSPASVAKYLAADGRLLVLAQSEAPQWLPAELPFASAVRTSIPEFDRAGWDTTNKDLIYSREVPVYAEAHPALAQLQSCDFKEWSPVDGRISDDVFVRPNAIDLKAGGAYRVLLGATRRENATLVEFKTGEGTGVLCQAQVLEQRAHPAARALLFNLLRYLDGPAWRTDCTTVGLVGELSAGRLSALTGIDKACFVPVTNKARAPQFILAGDRADPQLLLELARQGATVLVLSCETCSRLPGYEVELGEDHYHSATRAGVHDHPLFWGVAGASFLPLEKTPARSALRKAPDDARVLLGGHARGHSPFKNDWTVDIGFYGLETREPAPPIAVSQKLGQGELIATTLEPWDRRAEPHRQLLTNLLANAGVPTPDQSGQARTINIKHTVPLDFDGRLDDWTNDMEDINLSVHSHAEPIAIRSTDRRQGQVSGDLELSAVVYFLYDPDHLYIGGVVFAADKPAQLTIELDNHTLQLDPANQTLQMNGTSLEPAQFATGRQTASEIIDTRLLNLTRIHKQTGKVEQMPDTLGQTFELALPWHRLGFDQPPTQLQSRLQLAHEGGVVLQQPCNTADAEVNHLVLQIQEEQ